MGYLMSQELVAMRNDVKQLQRSFEDAFRAKYPEGSPIMWVRGNNRMHGVIMRYAYGERARVYNYGTQKEYFIYFSDILRAYEDA